MVAPIVFIAFIAIFEFGFLALALQFGHAALIEGTRRGAELYPPNYPLNQSGTDNDISDAVVQIVNRYLAIHSLEIADSANGFTDNTYRANAQIVIERYEGGTLKTITRGTNVNFPSGFTCTPSGNSPASNEIRVTLCFPLVDSNNPRGYGHPVPDWLSLYGISLGQRVFQVSARMTLE